MRDGADQLRDGIFAPELVAGCASALLGLCSGTTTAGAANPFGSAALPPQATAPTAQRMGPQQPATEPTVRNLEQRFAEMDTMMQMYCILFAVMLH